MALRESTDPISAEHEFMRTLVAPVKQGVLFPRITGELRRGKKNAGTKPAFPDWRRTLSAQPIFTGTKIFSPPRCTSRATLFGLPASMLFTCSIDCTDLPLMASSTSPC